MATRFASRPQVTRPEGDYVDGATKKKQASATPPNADAVAAKQARLRPPGAPTPPGPALSRRAAAPPVRPAGPVMPNPVIAARMAQMQAGAPPVMTGPIAAAQPIAAPPAPPTAIAAPAPQGGGVDPQLAARMAQVGQAGVAPVMTGPIAAQAAQANMVKGAMMRPPVGRPNLMMSSSPVLADGGMPAKPMVQRPQVMPARPMVQQPQVMPAAPGGAVAAMPTAMPARQQPGMVPGPRKKLVSAAGGPVVGIGAGMM